jgi:hypothetical protein
MSVRVETAPAPGVAPRVEAAPAQGVAPRPVYCVIEHLYRDRRLADDACRGRFTELGLTLQLGTRPDWTGAGFPADVEWRIAFGKFYFGLNLAAAFAATGDPRYQRTWEELVSSWIDQVPLGTESTDTVARRTLNWVYAWNEFAQASQFAGLQMGLDRTLLDSLAAQAGWLREHLTPARNHRTLELYALFICALALPGLDPRRELLEFAIAQLDENLSTDFRSDGVHVEASTHYHVIVLLSFVGLRVNARRFGIALPTGFDERLQRALDFAMHCHRPDGEIPALSDSDAGSYAELLRLAAFELNRPDYLYVATRGARGTPPRARNVSFPAGGYHVQRSGWGHDGRRYEDERFLIFDCGPLGDGGHGHYDLLSVEFAAGGCPLALDPGRFTYHEDGSHLRRWFKGTAAHNTVSVDGLDQTEYRAGKPKGPVAGGTFLARTQVPGLDVLWGMAVSPRYDARHARRVMFIDDDYWLFEDRLTARQPHRYELRWHLAPRAHERVELDRERALVSAPGLALAFAPQAELALEDGWYAPRYGIKYPAPVVRAVVEGTPHATFITLAIPDPDTAEPPRMRVSPSDGRSVTVEVRRAGAARAIDRISWSVDRPGATWRRLTEVRT